MAHRSCGRRHDKQDRHKVAMHGSCAGRKAGAKSLDVDDWRPCRHRCLACGDAAQLRVRCAGRRCADSWRPGRSVQRRVIRRDQTLGTRIGRFLAPDAIYFWRMKVDALPSIAIDARTTFALDYQSRCRSARPVARESFAPDMDAHAIRCCSLMFGDGNQPSHR